MIRFAPVAEGVWSFHTDSTDEENTDFLVEGTVTAVPYQGNLPIYRHGFLRVSGDGNHLEHADGTPFFWLGDTHWTFVTEERLNESNCPRYDSQFRACVDKRVQQKFTVYQCNFRDGKQNGMFGRSLDLMQETENGFLPNLEEFRENIDPKMKYLAEQGLVTAVGYAWANDIEIGGLERYKKFAKYTAARYGAYPVAWTLAGELPGYFHQDIIVPMWNEVAKECEKWSAYDNLQSVHQSCSRPFPCVYTEENWFDFAMSQAGHGDFPMPQKIKLLQLPEGEYRMTLTDPETGKNYGKEEILKTEDGTLSADIGSRIPKHRDGLIVVRFVEQKE